MVVRGSKAARRIPGTGIGEAMDYEAYVRANPRFRSRGVDGLWLIDGDLAIGDKPIAEVLTEDIDICRSITIERQIAAYWLEGDNRIYSKVSPSTLLSTR
jgi:hypothetical protein